MNSSSPTIAESLKMCLEEGLKPQVLQLINESRLHGGSTHPESHFKLTIVSSEFEGMRLLQRHRKVQELIKPFTASVKAISLHIFSSKEWESAQDAPLPGSQCMGKI